MYELPPILQGSEREQLVALRDYLVRMARDLDTNVEKSVVSTVQGAMQQQKSAGGTALGTGTGSTESEESKRLRSLIVKTADNIQHTIDMITTTLAENYVAKSEFGRVEDTIYRTIEDTARLTTEQFTAQFNTISRQQGALYESILSINGEIRRGYLTDPSTGDTVLGIAISQNLQFTENTQTVGGETFYEIDEGQTFGMYTSTGWQFWIRGEKVGWFASGDSSLHVHKIAVTENLAVGDGWIISTTDGFGIKKIATA